MVQFLPINMKFAYFSHFWWSKCYIIYETRIETCILRTFLGVNQVSMTSSSRDMIYMWIHDFSVMTSFRMTSKSHFRWFSEVTPNFFWILIPYPNSWNKDRRLPTKCPRNYISSRTISAKHHSPQKTTLKENFWSTLFVFDTTKYQK